MNNLNTVLPNGTFGVAVSTINSNFSLIVSAINSLEYASTKSRGIYNYGFTPSTTTLPNAVKGDWCMVLGEGNTFPADIYTFNGTSWSKGGTWNPEGIDLTQYPTKSEMNAAIAAIEIETVDNLNEDTAASGKALDAHQGFVLAGQIKGVSEDLKNKVNGKSQNDESWDFAVADANGNVVFCIKDGHVITKNFKSSTLTVGVADLDKENCAYAVTDANGNMAFVITEDGHIVTKNFCSRNVSAESLALLEKLGGLITKLNGKCMAIVGDSTSTYSGYIPTGWRSYYPQDTITNSSYTYWSQVAEFFGMTVQNCSYSASYATGDSTQTEVSESHEQGECAGCSEVRIASLTRDNKTPDIVLVFLGANDYNYGKSLGSWTEHSAIPSEGTIGNFSSAYALMLHKIKTALPNARIFCCTILQRSFNFPEKTSSVKDFNDVIKRMADIFGCDVIDTYACGISRYNLSTYTQDSHANREGHKLIAHKIITELMAKY
jgi:hypothetical protein